jgi:hypothetical protein
VRYKGSLGKSTKIELETFGIHGSTLLSVQRTRKDESKYYEDLLEYGKKNLLLFPYHLSDVIIKGLGTTPFQYYVSMLDSQMSLEKSYDSLPNFTAADCKCL